MTETQEIKEFRPLPAPWDRIFGVGSRVFVWGIIFGILYLLRSFFLLIFLTFVFAFIQANGVHLIRPYINRRGLAVTLVGLVFLGVIIALGYFLTPRVKEQAVIFANNYPLYLKTIDAELVSLMEKYPVLRGLFPGVSEEGEEDPTAHMEEPWDPASSPSRRFVHQMLGFSGTGGEQENLKQALERLQGIGQQLAAIVSSFLLALLFSFLIVLDLPRLTKSVTSLAQTKLSFIYREVAENIKNFGLVMGRALMAQLMIAIMNTFFTAFIIHFLGLGSKMAFLSIIVFLCSFIPVAGVFISSVPICLLVLQQSGAAMVLVAALGIWVVHMIEAYVLNPLIYGERMHMNPVLVLVILTICGKLFHIWGLVLGIPVATYFFGHAIQYVPKKGHRVLNTESPSDS